MTASKCSWRLMPSLRQSVQTSTRFLACASWATRSARSSGGRVPVMAATSTSRSFLRNSSATYSAVGMKRQKTIGLKPSRLKVSTKLMAFFNFSSLVPSSFSASRAMSSSRRRVRCSSPLASPRSLPGVRSRLSTDLIGLQIKHRLAANRIGFIGGLRIGARGSGAQCGNGSRRAGGQ